jgi:hypothetical protein
MPNENEKVEEKVEATTQPNNEKVEDTKTTEEVKVDEKKPENVANQEEVPTQKEEADKSETPSDKEPKVDEQQNNVVQEEIGNPNGISINDVVTKQQLEEVLNALTSKYDALFKENQDLKAQNEQYKSKYETGDFGGNVKSGLDIDEKGKKMASDSFDEYCKNYLS